MEYLAYLLKNRWPGLFRLVAAMARGVTSIRYGRRLHQAAAKAKLEGEVLGRSAIMRPLNIEDSDQLQDFLRTIPETHLKYFQPHGFEKEALEEVLSSRAFQAYGLFVDGDMGAYALLKISPTGSAFLGRLVAPQFTGCGLGSFLSRYLYWQAGLAGLRPRSTISRHNTASLGSHQAAAEFNIIRELPNDYLLIEFTHSMTEPPTLLAPRK